MFTNELWDDLNSTSKYFAFPSSTNGQKFETGTFIFIFLFSFTESLSRSHEYNPNDSEDRLMLRQEILFSL